MIQITPHIKIRIAIEPVDFRKGIDGLAQCCRVIFEEDPFLGAMFIFKNKRSTAIKVLVYDGQGFWLCQKRLSKGVFKWWPKVNADSHNFTPTQAHAVLSCCDPSLVKSSDFRRII